MGKLKKWGLPFSLAVNSSVCKFSWEIVPFEKLRGLWAISPRSLHIIKLLSSNFSVISCCFGKAQPMHTELTKKILGNKATFSPIVTLEPRRRKFHKPITMTIPVPKASSDGLMNGYGGDTPTLRLLCSITGRMPVLELSMSILKLSGNAELITPRGSWMENWLGREAVKISYFSNNSFIPEITFVVCTN